MQETWSEIEGFPNYMISNTGKVINVKSGKEKATKDCKGYPAVDLYSNGQRTTKRVHRIVAETFLPRVENKDDINHIDGNKYNSNINNLEWCDKSYNMKHAFRTGLAKPSRSMLGRKNPNAGRHGIPIEIVETGEVFSSSLDCERKTGLSNKHINDCLKGRQQTHGGYHFRYI